MVSQGLYLKCHTAVVIEQNICSGICQSFYQYQVCIRKYSVLLKTLVNIDHKYETSVCKIFEIQVLMCQEAQTLVEERHPYYCLPLFYYAKENVITP